ncbi:plastocyanin/azurin family copper-binding protein [Halobacterium sp. R2-5]|uniref:plastocyanin/azurin family copper-binding protein n=1 Tax=Halobacterium sp. R2-5 TaxID=2715751 RepID=UPI001423F4B8|nr:plastocyanin/azurin family copper-binding protein [Halobacterium sp. R2-5]NIB99015.1 hypothetical protein [Halobacterium sp. R2-5]
MSRNHDEPTGDADRTLGDWTRRTVLKLTGGGVALGAFAGGNALAQQDDGEGDGGGSSSGEESQEDGTDDSALVDDLVDPTWGYPLAADETDSVGVEYVVEMVTEEGDGAHENFPADPSSGDSAPFEFYFDPVGVRLDPGTVVKFVSTAGEHTATAFHEKYTNPVLSVPTRIPDDVPGFTSPPIVGGEAWLYQFETRGVYDVLCLPHLGLGMVMRAVVFDPEEDDAEDDAFAAPDAGDLPPNVQQVFDAPELDPANIVDEGSVAWADLTLGGE